MGKHADDAIEQAETMEELRLDHLAGACDPESCAWCSDLRHAEEDAAMQHDWGNREP